MLNTFFSSIITRTVSWQAILLCTLSSVILGALSAGIYCYRNTYTKSFVVTLSLLPVIVQTVIMLVNGNLGAGVAVMGAFSLVRFRSVPGSAREITSLFRQGCWALPPAWATSAMPSSSWSSLPSPIFCSTTPALPSQMPPTGN